MLPKVKNRILYPSLTGRPEYVVKAEEASRRKRDNTNKPTER